MVELTTIVLSKELRNKLMKIKYDRNYDSIEQVILYLLEDGE